MQIGKKCGRLWQLIFRFWSTTLFYDFKKFSPTCPEKEQIWKKNDDEKSQ